MNKTVLYLIYFMDWIRKRWVFLLIMLVVAFYGYFTFVNWPKQPKPIELKQKFEKDMKAAGYHKEAVINNTTYWKPGLANGGLGDVVSEPKWKPGHTEPSHIEGWVCDVNPKKVKIEKPVHNYTHR